MHRLSRDRKSALHFRTYRRPLDKLAKRILQIMVGLEPAVIADFFAKQAGAYSKLNLLVHSNFCVVPIDHMLFCHNLLPDQYCINNTVLDAATSSLIYVFRVRIGLVILTLWLK